MDFPLQFLQLTFGINFLSPLGVLYISQTPYPIYYGPNGIQPIFLDINIIIMNVYYLCTPPRISWLDDR
jgi:hypothetical protein